MQPHKKSHGIKCGNLGGHLHHASLAPARHPSPGKVHVQVVPKSHVEVRRHPILEDKSLESSSKWGRRYKVSMSCTVYYFKTLLQQNMKRLSHSFIRSLRECGVLQCLLIKPIAFNSFPFHSVIVSSPPLFLLLIFHNFILSIFGNDALLTFHCKQFSQSTTCTHNCPQIVHNCIQILSGAKLMVTVLTQIEI